MIDQISTIKDLAQHPKLAEKTTYKLTADGMWPGFKAGGSWRFRQADISWIEATKLTIKTIVKSKQR